VLEDDLAVVSDDDDCSGELVSGDGVVDEGADGGEVRVRGRTGLSGRGGASRVGVLRLRDAETRRSAQDDGEYKKSGGGL